MKYKEPEIEIVLFENMNVLTLVSIAINEDGEGDIGEGDGEIIF